MDDKSIKEAHGDCSEEFCRSGENCKTGRMNLENSAHSPVVETYYREDEQCMILISTNLLPKTEGRVHLRSLASRSAEN